MKNKVTPTLFILLVSISNALLSQKAIIPIHFAGKLILIEGTVNGKKGFFILDLGATGLVLNKQYFSGTSNNMLKAYGVNGALSSLETCIANLTIGEIIWKNKEATLLPLSYLENSREKQILGLVGGNLFRKSELIIDFQEKVLLLSNNVEQNTGPTNVMLAKNKGLILPFKMKGGMPWIEVRLNSV